MPRSKAVAKKTDLKKKVVQMETQKVARKSAPVQTGIKKQKWKPGEIAMREIRKYQKSNKLLIQKAVFQRNGFCSLI